MKIYGKQTVTEPMAAMSRSGRYVHSYIITGAKGCGKKTAAAYIAQMLLCSDIHDGVPCGTCRECRRIEAQTHPDVILVEKSKTSFSVSDMRHIVTDAYTSPNDCDRKVYIAADCDGWSDAAQAAMLKVTEDPPDPVYFIFTGADLSVFLPTLISRSMTIGITEDRDACVSFLRDRYPDKAEDELLRAAEAFSGNIGRCTELLDGDEKLIDLVDRARRTASALAAHDEYTAAVMLAGIKDRGAFKELLGMLTAIVRDAAAGKTGSAPVSCDAKDASKLSSLPYDRLMMIYDRLAHGMELCGTYCNLEALSAMLTGQIFG
ncbi:MAG: hypothetical protein IKR73_04945 [Oscillospiraceae bacterium]|nr:hypothetical protein [Oscillospiraceae bacterium]